MASCAGGAIYAAPAEVSVSAPNIVAAVADSRRPEADRARDALRHPADMLAFAQIEPGDRVADILPGGGYFTRLFAVAVGEGGRVYPVIRPPETASQYETPILEVAAQYPNAVMARVPFTALAFPEPLDVVFTAQNYHDLKIAEYNMGDTAAVNRAAFNALKPGGLYVVIDHSAADGSGITSTESLHRIDQALVRREIEAAGFVFDGETQVLRNPADARTLNVFDAGIRGHTDQFALRFRKPA
jgi:predicted methyltransferase